MLVLMGIGLVWRLYWFSGYGLGDDVHFRTTIRSIVDHALIPANAYGYRVTWWLPTAAACRLLGVGEAGMIAPITAMATLGIGLVYVLGKQLYGSFGASAAAALLVVQPLDVAWSTMLANDVFTSVFQAVCVLYLLRATESDDPLVRQRCWLVVPVALYAAYHAKASTLALVPALAIIVWWRRARIGREAWIGVAAGSVLFGLDALGSYALAGTPIGAYAIEMRLAGLWQADALVHRRLTMGMFLSYPRWLLWRDHLGGWLYAGQPFAVIVLAAASRWLRVWTSREVLVWFLAVFCASQFQMTLYDGVPVAVFRNIRHSHPLVYPVVLLLAGYLASLAVGRPRFARALLGVLLGVGLWSSAGVAAKTQATFGDERAVARLLARLPPKRVYADFHMADWYPILNGQPLAFERLSDDKAARRAELAKITDGYVVTGGGREPYYGCWHCIPQADEIPPGRFRLLMTYPGPEVPTPWRAEPARVWEAIPPDAPAPSR